MEQEWVGGTRGDTWYQKQQQEEETSKQIITIIIIVLDLNPIDTLWQMLPECNVPLNKQKAQSKQFIQPSQLQSDNAL